jgi:glucosamine--fructose-6-phosphate aminotransferase (isomerizing)
MEGVDKHNDNIAIGHTRWATHGDKNENNSHPHFDHKERVAIVHNGIIENYHELKKELKDVYKLEPKTETDTEVVAMFIGVYLDQGKSLFDSIQCAVDKLSAKASTYSIALISVLEPDAMYIFKNAGTMAIGVSESLTM